MLEEKIRNLEEKFSHQDYLLDQLNKIISQQQKIIETLQSDIIELKLSQGENNSQSRTLEDDVPPHY